jgi:hypothetical protein
MPIHGGELIFRVSLKKGSKDEMKNDIKKEIMKTYEGSKP